MKKLAVSLVAALTMALAPVSLVAAANTSVCSDPAAAKSAFCIGSQSPKDNISGPSGVLVQIANIVAIAAGLVMVIMIIVAGLRFVTSAGDSAGVEKAKNTILHSIIGIVVIVFARVLIWFLVTRIK